MNIYDFKADNLKKFKDYNPSQKCKNYGAVCIKNELYFLLRNKDHVDNKKTFVCKTFTCVKNLGRVRILL